MYRTKFFAIEELVPQETLKKNNGQNDKLFMLFDVNALRTLDMLRKRYGPVVVNNWHLGGSFKYSGWREWDCPEGARLSQHKFGRAFDCKFSQATADEVRHDLALSPANEEFAHITRIEAFQGMSWFHFDTGNHNRETGIAVFGG